MTIFDRLFPLGIGTNRFAVKDANDEAGLNRAAALVAAALEAGCSYIDVASSYSKGFAGEICRRAFQLTDAKKDVAVKVSFLSDVTADDVLRRVESEFEKLGITHASFLVVWNISSLAQFERIMAGGALYEGAARARERGLIDHICFSSHARPEEITQIIESGAFEGGTIAFSPLNSFLMEPVLDAALRQGVGLCAMNPLGGGILPQAGDYFSFLRCQGDASVAIAALRYVYAHPAIQIALSGMSSLEQLQENLSAFTAADQAAAEARIRHVKAEFAALEDYCTGCRYCMPCPAGMDIPAFMQSRNAMLLPTAPMYNRTDPEVLHNIQLFRKLQLDFSILPEDGRCKCLDCGACEKKCTQHLPIRAHLKEIFSRVNTASFSLEARKARLDRLLNGKNYRRVGFYPGGLYTAKILELYTDFFGPPPFQAFLFDSNPASWGTAVASYTVHPPQEISQLGLDAVIITNYIYLEEIYQSISSYEAQGIHILKLHEPDDVPWVF